VSPDAHELKEQILTKMQMIRNLRVPPPKARPQANSRVSFTNEAAPPPPLPVPAGVPPRNVVVIGSSTGGPTALIDIFARMPARAPTALLVAQHMPDKFTRTFAERLDRKGAMRVTEAQDMDVVSASTGTICPGRQCMEIEMIPGTTEYRVRISAPSSTDRYVPSANRLFRSAATSLGHKAIGVVLTGMGDDGVEGAKAIRNAGGMIIAESPETAVVYGMPGAVVRAGVASESLPLAQIAEYLANLS
jgi:two-component system chemotaxis response regulator CheB